LWDEREQKRKINEKRQLGNKTYQSFYSVEMRTQAKTPKMDIKTFQE